MGILRPHALPISGIGPRGGVIHVLGHWAIGVIGAIGAMHRFRTPMLHSPSTPSGVELTAKQMCMLFPSPMFTGKLSDIGLCDRIETRLRQLQKSGKGMSSPEGTILAYMTPDDIQNLPEMKELVEVIMVESGNILDAYRIKRDAHYITNMWANIANPNRRHHFHIHPNCLLSGLVYIKTPKHCGSTVFASPRQLTKNIEPTYARLDLR